MMAVCLAFSPVAAEVWTPDKVNGLKAGRAATNGATIKRPMPSTAA